MTQTTKTHVRLIHASAVAIKNMTPQALAVQDYVSTLWYVHVTAKLVLMCLMTPANSSIAASDSESCSWRLPERAMLTCP